MSKLKKGDYIKILSVEYPHRMEHLIGNIYKINSVNDTHRLYLIKLDWTTWCFSPDEIKEVTYFNTPLYKALNAPEQIEDEENNAKN